METLKVLSVFGTRPEAIKMAPLIKELEKRKDIKSLVCVTAQHREMLDRVLSIFEIVPDYDLNIMKPGQTISDITCNVIRGLEEVIRVEKPDLLLVHGDTTTAFASAYAAFINGVKVGHVEAGLRTYDKYSPFPEEMNRCLISDIAELNFAPTIKNKKNLQKENKKNIYVTGNTVIDALSYTVRKDNIFRCEELNRIDYKKYRVITITAHRRENLGEHMKDIFSAVREIAEGYENVRFVFPVHLNPVVREAAKEVLSGCDKIVMIDPIDVDDMHNLMKRSYLVMTDSGGLQEEAPAMGIPVLVLRKETERPEAVKAGTVKMAGVEKKAIVRLAKELLDDEKAYKACANAVNPYGDGHASERIAEAIEYAFGLSYKIPGEFQ